MVRLFCRIRRSWYLPAPRLEHLDSAHLELVSVSSSTNSKNFTFQAKCKLSFPDDHFQTCGNGRQIKSRFTLSYLVLSLIRLVPPRGTIFIAPREGYRMTSWSLETYVPPVTDCPGKYADRGCYFVFYARGFGEGRFTFWIELEVSRTSKFHH